MSKPKAKKAPPTLPKGIRLMTDKEAMAFIDDLGRHLLTDASAAFREGSPWRAAAILKTLSVTALSVRRAVLGKEHTMVTDAPNARALASRVRATLAEVRAASVPKTAPKKKPSSEKK